MPFSYDKLRVENIKKKRKEKRGASKKLGQKDKERKREREREIREFNPLFEKEEEDLKFLVIGHAVLKDMPMIEGLLWQCP